MVHRKELGIALCLIILCAPFVAAQDGLETAQVRLSDRSDPAALKVELAAPFDVTVIHTDLVGDPTAAVPGFAGVQFSSFDRPYGSPNGNWIISTDTDRPTGTDEALLANDVVQLFEGDPAAWASGELVGFLDTKLGINDAGDWVFATNTDGVTTADEYIVQSVGGVLSAAAQEGGAIPALTPPLSVPASNWGSTLESPVIASDGTVGFSSDTLTGPPTTENDILVLGTSLLGQEGITQPTGQIGTEAWENFDLSDFWINAAGTSWIAQGDLTGDTTTDDVAVVDGAVVIQEGVVIPGSGFAEPVDSSGIVGVHMDPAGNWFARGNNDVSEQDWVVRNGAVIAKTGDPIFTGATELWSDVDFADCFFFHVGNSLGDYVIGGVTDAASDQNGVLVANGTVVVAREGEPIDLDGNGVFDDNANFNTFGNDDAYLSDDRVLYVVATMRDDAGTSIGDAFVSIDLSSIATQNPAISLVKTVGTDPGVCATTDTITVVAGTTVYYCYEVTNTGDVTFEIHDLVDDQLGTILTGFAFTLEPGISVNTVDAGLTVSAVMTTTTTNTGTWTAYDAAGAPTEAMASATVTVVAPPDIGVDPASLFSSQLTNTTNVQQLTISNAGGSDLAWDIFEEPADAVPEPPDAQEPTIRFDSAAAMEAEESGLEDGAEPQETGPRDPVAAARARHMLFTAGLLLIPDSTNDRVMAFDPATGNLVDADFIPADPTNLSTPKAAILSASGTSILVADQIDDVVQEYAMDGTYIGVFAPAGGVNNAILDNMRGISLDASGNLLVTVGSGANADAVAQFDTAGNYVGNFIANGAGGLDSPFDVYGRAADWLVTASTSDAVHRYDTAGTYIDNLALIDNFPQQVSEAANGNVLVADFGGTQEGVIEYQPDGTLVGIYNPAVLGGYRGVYELPNGNILTTNSDGVHEIDRSGNLVETKISGLSAQYIGVAAPQVACENLADVPWLSASPITGTTAPAGSTPIDVTFDSTGISVGIYDANLCIFSDDPDEPVIPIPVQMEVVIPVELMGFTVE